MPNRGRGHPWGIFFGFYKTRHVLLSDSANCTVLRAVVLTQYRRVTDNILAGGSSVLLISEGKVTDPHTALEAPALHTLRLIARQP